MGSLINDTHTYKNAGSALTLNPADAGITVRLQELAGSAVILPKATGSGIKFRFIVSVLATSVSHTITAPGDDVFRGVILGARVDSGNAVLGFAAGATDNTVTLNRTTTGSVSLGEYVDVEDMASGVWAIRGVLTATGAAFATPFSDV
jgi:hypothetical protein